MDEFNKTLDLDGLTYYDTKIKEVIETKAPLASPELTGIPKAPTASAGTNTTQIATTAFVQTAVSNKIADLIDGAPETMDTLKEVSDAIAAHQDVTDALNSAIGTKVDTVNGDTYIGASKSGTTASITHKDVSRSNTTSTTSPSHGGTFTAVKTITSDTKGHVTGVNTETVTLPAQYSHPSYTARTGVPTANQTPAFGGTFSVSQPVSDANGHITAMNSKTITIPNSVATQSSAGLESASDKKKLDGIATGAEVNQNAFSKVTVGSTTIEADSKTDTLTLVAGSNVTLTPDATNDKITIASAHPSITTSTDTTSTASPSAGGTFTTVDSVTRDSNGHVTKVNTKTVTLPSTNVTVDSALSSTSTNPVQNKVVNSALGTKIGSSDSITFDDSTSTYSTLSAANSAAETSIGNIKTGNSIVSFFKNAKQSFSAIIQGLKILGTNVGAISGITDSLTATSSNVALSANGGNNLQGQINTLNSNLQKFNSNYKTIIPGVYMQYSGNYRILTVNAQYSNIKGILIDTADRPIITVANTIIRTASNGLYATTGFLQVTTDGILLAKKYDVYNGTSGQSDVGDSEWVYGSIAYIAV